MGGLASVIQQHWFKPISFGRVGQKVQTPLQRAQLPLYLWLQVTTSLN